MSTKHMSAALLVLLLTATASATQAAPAHVRHARSQASSFAPARMMEARPGLWVGSYQCIVDLERGGRDCSSGN